MTTLARSLFANLSVSAKIHRSLASVQQHQVRRHHDAVRAFDTAVASAVQTLAPRPASERDRRIAQLRADFDQLERAYEAMKLREDIPLLLRPRFNTLFASIRQRLLEKERATSPSP
jgi:hypothetical protein